MRTTLSLRSSLAAAAFCAVAASPAIAQHATATGYLRPVVNPASATADGALRTVAFYRFGTSRELGMPTQVTVADSAGTLVASFRLAGTRASRPMTVDVNDTDLLLQGETPSGVLTLELYQQQDSDAPGAVVGHWWLGKQQGTLRGRTVR